MKDSLVTASYLMIGDEILSGRTKDQNLNFLASQLVSIGINLKEVRVVPDDENEIILAVNDLRKKYNYLFTTGGIGPTHDDITSLAIAKAFNDKLVKNKKALEILIDHYTKENINEARLKMAFVPSKSKLLDNSISSAPGFVIDNVIVMAGVPKIMQAMFKAAKKDLVCGSKIKSKEIKVSLTESRIAKELEELQNKFKEVSMGSYPYQGGTSLVFRSSNLQKLDESVNCMIKILNNGEHKFIVDAN